MSFDFVSNPVFRDRISAWAPQGQQMITNAAGERVSIGDGVRVDEEGNAYFTLYAPNAKEVSVAFGIKAHLPIPMDKDENGVWHCTVPYDPTFVGPKAFTFRVDGATFVSPWCPQYYSHSMAINFVEIPDPNTPYVLMRRDVPHGSVVTEYYWSEPHNDWQRCLVYLPAGYEKGGEYPVFYLQHGAGENETSWVFNGRANHILDNLISDSTAAPMIVVMNDGMARAGVPRERGAFNDVFARSLLECCIPFIESKYRVKADKWNRALAGFSMGSMQSSIIGLTHTDTFAWIGLLSGFMSRIAPDADKITVETNPHLAILTDEEKFKSEVKLFYRGIGSEDGHFSAYAKDDEYIKENGYDKYDNFVSRVVDKYPHDWAVLRILLADFASRIFK